MIALAVILSAVAGYLLGSIMFSLLISNLRGIDIRHYGSGNAGFTNVLRVMGWKWGLLTFVGDFAKSVLATFLGFWIAKWLGDTLITINYVDMQLSELCMYAGGLSALIGHTLPLYFGFKGGKGITTTAGSLLCICPVITVVAFGIGIIVMLLTKTVSVGSLIGVVLLVTLVLIYHWGKLPLMIFMGLILITTWYSHRANIKRIVEGNENQLAETKWEEENIGKK